MAKEKRPSIKNEEQYEALRDKGMSQEKAARIANTEDSGKKGGKAKPYEERTKEDLYEQVQSIGIEGRSSMNKKELIEALRKG
jgi:Rho termination factor, N-terminal domain.